MNERVNIDTDIIIVGGGGAGMAAALSAAEKGCKNITVIEKSGATAGSTAMSHDIFGAESPVQKRAGIDAGRDVLFKRAMEWSHWTKVNPRIVRAFIDKSGDTISWLEGMGIEFAITQYFPGQVPWVRHYMVNGQGAHLMRTLRLECDKRGVKVYTHMRGEKILKGEDGIVRGIVAKGKENEIIVNAKSVIITTGGYGNNKEMLNKHCPYYHDTISYDGPPSNTGDGITMAVAVGAATDGMGAYNMHGPFLSSREAPGMPVKAKGSDGQPLKVRLFEMAWEPYTLWVNLNGRRFIDEAYAQAFFAFGNAYALQPEGVGFTLFDSDTLAKMEKEGLVRVGIFGIHTLHNFVPPAIPLPGLADAMNSYQANNDVFKISSSWDEMAVWMGTDATILKATIKEYNASCACGHDALFVKEQRYLRPLHTPPYYAIRCHVSLCDAYGGIKINEKMEALDISNKVIPGLYAAGSTTGCWESESYCYHLTGHLVGFAINSGRIAGENAVAYIHKE